VHVQVEKPGRDVEPSALHDLEGPSRVDGLGDRGDAAVVHGDIADRAQPVPRVDEVATLQQQVDFGLAGRAGRTRQRERGGARQELPA